jgi:nicotinamidase-related amidase
MRDQMRSVLLAMHYQNDVVHPEGRIRFGLSEGDARRAGVIAAAGRLLAGARAHGVPIISVRVAFRSDYAEVVTNAEIWRRLVSSRAFQEGSWGAEFYDGLGPLPGEFVVTHTRNDAFYASSLEGVLRALRPDRLIVAGIATNFSVESTARHASDAGYDTGIAEDACSAASPEAQRASLAALAMLATVRKTDDIVADWAKGA